MFVSQGEHCSAPGRSIHIPERENTLTEWLVNLMIFLVFCAVMGARAGFSEMGGRA